jgi:hypothetical protein
MDMRDSKSAAARARGTDGAMQRVKDDRSERNGNANVFTSIQDPSRERRKRDWISLLARAAQISRPNITRRAYDEYRMHTHVVAVGPTSHFSDATSTAPLDDALGIGAEGGRGSDGTFRREKRREGS